METLKKELYSLVEENLTKYIDSHVEWILKVGNYILESGGKRIRPILTLGFAKLLNKENIEGLIPLAVALEYLHTASLLHDDVVDEADTRRGKPSANRVFGNDTVVLTGDYMYADALYIFSTYGNIDMIRVVSDAVKKMAEGQLLELKKIGDYHLSKEDYYRIIDGKTAVLFAACSYVGANYANNDKNLNQKAYKYGLYIGRAFQIVDDVLDYISTEEKVGKPTGNDIREGKITLPLIAVRDKLTPEEVSFIKKVLTTINPKVKDIQKVKNLVIERGGVDKAILEAKEYVRKAIHCLEEFPNNIYCKDLKNLAEYIVEREF